MLFPTIYLYWKKYQSTLLEKAKAIKGGMVLADGCHDSMGHCQISCIYNVLQFNRENNSI